jgi:hypothetical protein
MKQFSFFLILILSDFLCVRGQNYPFEITGPEQYGFNIIPTDEVIPIDTTLSVCKIRGQLKLTNRTGSTILLIECSASRYKTLFNPSHFDRLEVPPDSSIFISYKRTDYTHIRKPINMYSDEDTLKKAFIKIYILALIKDEKTEQYTSIIESIPYEFIFKKAYLKKIFNNGKSFDSSVINSNDMQIGSGGDYLSNEIFYRISRARENAGSTVKTGHFHLANTHPNSILSSSIVPFSTPEIINETENAIIRCLTSI